MDRETPPPHTYFTDNPTPWYFNLESCRLAPLSWKWCLGGRGGVSGSLELRAKVCPQLAPPICLALFFPPIAHKDLTSLRNPVDFGSDACFGRESSISLDTVGGPSSHVVKIKTNWNLSGGGDEGGSAGRWW